MRSLLDRCRISFFSEGFGALLLFLVYGIFLVFFLFSSVHDRTDAEFRQRADPRFEKNILVWINHGFIKHGGLRFLKPIEEGVPISVSRSTSMAWLQSAHILQRVHIYFKGEFSHRLMAFHNQLFPLLASALLGFLAMRLTSNMNIPHFQTLFLGMSVQTVHQTLPLNLGLIWGINRQSAITLLVILFLVIEENCFRKGNSFKTSLMRGIVVFIMAYCDPSGCAIFLIAYYTFRVMTMPWQLKFWDIFKSALLPSLGGLGIQISQIFLIQNNYPEVKFSGSDLLVRTGFDGDTTYYMNHWDLFSDKWLLNFPGSNPLFLSGILALMLVITFVQMKKRYFSQQIILLSGLGCFIFFAFMLSETVVIHPYAFQLYLAWPLILALFALLPAWLEIFNLRSGIFVFFSCLIAFFVSGSQLLAYFLSMPPLWYL